MKAYITFTKKGLLIAFAVFICIVFVCSEVFAAGNKQTNAKTNAERLLFIKGLGYTVLSDEPTAKTVNIPEVFYDVYNNYNTLQQSSGYDLSLYKGCEVTIYTYSINPPSDYSGECVINIIVYNDRVIGGDVSSSALGGFMLPINNKSE